MIDFASFNSKLVKDKELRYLIRTITIASKNCNITLEYSICKKKTGSDTLKRHWLTKHNNFVYKVSTLVRGFVIEKDSEPFSIEDLEFEMLANDMLFDEKIEIVRRFQKC